VQDTVEHIIADVKLRGDAAVRELSGRFDHWSPASFRLSQEEIASQIAQVSRQTIDDITFAQAQIRNFAKHQKAALKDIEVETLPGVRLGTATSRSAAWAATFPAADTPWWHRPT